MQPKPYDALLAEAERVVERYVAEHPGASIDGAQPEYRGGTNRVILGSHHGQSVVFKYFVTPQRWLNERTCLQHFQSARIVPRVIDAVPERLLVIEMCRSGTESMQLGVAVELCGPGRLDWAHLQRGYEAEVGLQPAETDLLAVLAMNHFYHWIRACRWGNWDGDPGETEHLRDAAKDAEHHISRMKAACRVLGEHVDVTPWFGHL